MEDFLLCYIIQMNSLPHILERIDSKKRDFALYNFRQTENNALTIFFDLAQEFDNLDDFYNLCVAVPKGFLDLDAKLYLIDPKTNDLSLIATTEDSEYHLHTPPPYEIAPEGNLFYTASNSLVVIIRGKSLFIDQLPFKTKDDILGLLEVYPAADLGPHSELFLEKYANRVGYSIHNKLVLEKYIEHLKFIRSLVADIEHNIIAPNIVYKLFLKHMRRKIEKNIELEKVIAAYATTFPDGQFFLENLLLELNEINRGLGEELENIEKHHKNMSLFLETLLRRSHFDKGRLTLLTKKCYMNKDVVQPQIERSIDKFNKLGISVNYQTSGIPDQETVSVVDVGLMAQVYANLFSNALKYTEEIVTYSGEKKKYISYGHEIIRDYFGPGKDGIKYNVFSTGPHIPPEEREKIFEDEYRGSNVLNRPGTGHGLAFIKTAVELHGGIVGYEPTQYGNNFFLILPR
ncbi:MAG: sensor histidine kinase [Nitrospiraceae bacterium]|nr:MAG: sensor histidine kinase [Nitrospiraceae bacterium]